MIESREMAKIDFIPFDPKDKALYEHYLIAENGRGCEFSFANLYLWGQQQYAFLYDHIVLFSRFDRRVVYPYPLGTGDKKVVIDRIIGDAGIRKIPCVITGLNELAKQALDDLYPGRFRFYSDEGRFDYVYDIDDLADLAGKKYHGKRNHLNRFVEQFPHFSFEVLYEKNLSKAEAMADAWYEERLREDPSADYRMERAALKKAFKDYSEIGMEGLMLLNGEEVLAFTLASRLSEDTFDVHFEKALPSARGAYTAINQGFARYIRNKYPDIRYLDREEDMGLEGLRKAKRSYHPHHMITKYWACLLEDEYDH